MKFLTNIFIITFSLLLFVGCKRKCQDERADNYGENRKDYCDYSYADNWTARIIVDSVLINGFKIDFKGGSGYEGESYNSEENFYEGGGVNRYSMLFDADMYLPDTLNTIEYTIGIPIADNFDEDLRSQEVFLHTFDTVPNPNESQTAAYENEVFTFIEIKNENGVDYYYYKVLIENVDQDIMMNKDNFSYSIVDVVISYVNLEFGVTYTITLRKE